jgi:hypothetical protein
VSRYQGKYDGATAAAIRQRTWSSGGQRGGKTRAQVEARLGAGASEADIRRAMEAALERRLKKPRP